MLSGLLITVTLIFGAWTFALEGSGDGIREGRVILQRIYGTVSRRAAEHETEWLRQQTSLMTEAVPLLHPNGWNACWEKYIHQSLRLFTKLYQLNKGVIEVLVAGTRHRSCGGKNRARPLKGVCLAFLAMRNTKTMPDYALLREMRLFITPLSCNACKLSTSWYRYDQTR